MPGGSEPPLSHDLPCPLCAHDHTYLPCDWCACDHSLRLGIDTALGGS